MKEIHPIMNSTYVTLWSKRNEEGKRHGYQKPEDLVNILLSNQCFGCYRSFYTNELKNA